ncbi:hypothetical protein [Streptomyces sp. NPDC006879]|uniref:hypothetical protein n=1 Tax=Streptomyces sp. NPDC006879 TaxID=3364767 RepID=UPI00368FA935
MRWTQDLPEARRTPPEPMGEELDQVLRVGPFHLALRAALSSRGLPLQRVQHHLANRGIKVGVTSLCYWQQGARRPQRAESLKAVRALEEILELPPETLLRLLKPPDPRPPARPYRSLVSVADALHELLKALEAPVDGGLHTVGHHERVSIGARRELRVRDSQQVVRAHREGVDRYLAIHHGDPGCDPARVAVRADENCRAGRVRHHHRTGVVVAELLFDTRLRTGDTHFFRYRFEDGTGGPSTEYLRGFNYAGGQYVLQIGFDERALPMRCRRFAQASSGAARTEVFDLTPSGRHRTVHLVETGVRRGILGIDWDWG